jgi:predicted  nucleic acid-binding Zn-ribbon protein
VGQASVQAVVETGHEPSNRAAAWPGSPKLPWQDRLRERNTSDPDRRTHENTNMSGPAAILREIHRLLRFARDLQEQIDRGPKQLKVQQIKISRQEDVQREAQEALKKLKLAVHDKEVTLKGIHTLIAKHQKQLNEATSKKEYDALRVEIASEQAKCAKLEDEILAAMAETEEHAAKLPELEKTVQRAREEYKKLEAGAAERAGALAQQLDETKARLKEIEPSIPAKVQEQYHRIVTAQGADAFAAVVDRNCGACYTGITAQQYTDLLMQNFVACKSCGRMLYLPE